MATSLSIVSFEFDSYNSQKIAELATKEIKTNSEVKAHGGKIWAENNADGKGSTFTFALPMLISKGRPLTHR